MTAAATVAVAFAEAGEWSATLSVAAIGLVSQRVVAWLVPNKEDE